MKLRLWNWRKASAPWRAKICRKSLVAEAYQWTQGEWQLGKGYSKIDNPEFHVVAYDFGVKHNILPSVFENVAWKSPWCENFAEGLGTWVDGIFSSSLPRSELQITPFKPFNLITKQKPLFGICLGNYLVWRSAKQKNVFRTPRRQLSQ